MKIVKKIMSLTLMVIMVMLFIVPYVNAEDQTYSIILSNIDEREHTYYAYQIFTGTVDSQTSFCDLEWGNGINEDYRGTILGAYGQKNIEGLSNLLCNDINANDFARYLCSNIGYLQNGLNGAAATGTNAEKTVKFENLKPGYYLILDKVSDSKGEEKYLEKESMLVVAGDVSMEVKNESMLLKMSVSPFESTPAGVTNQSIANSISAKNTVTADLTVPKDYKSSCTATFNLGTGFDEAKDVEVWVIYHDGEAEKKEKLEERAEFLTIVKKTNAVKVKFDSKCMEELKKIYSDGFTFKCVFNVALNETANIGNNSNREGNMITGMVSYSSGFIGGDGDGEDMQTEKVYSAVYTLSANVKSNVVGTFRLNKDGVEYAVTKNAGTVVGNGTVTGFTVNSDEAATFEMGDQGFTLNGLGLGEYEIEILDENNSVARRIDLVIGTVTTSLTGGITEIAGSINGKDFAIEDACVPVECILSRQREE